MYIARPVLLILALSPLCNSLQCEVDYDCNKNEYCYESGTCAQCVTCAKYNREPHASIACVKKVSDCGRCFEGFGEEYLSGNKRRNLCTDNINAPSNNTEDAGNADQYTENIFIIILAIVGAMAIIAIMLVLWLFVRKYFKRSTEQTPDTESPHIDQEHDPPPAYNRTAGGGDVEVLSHLYSTSPLLTIESPPVPTRPPRSDVSYVTLADEHNGHVLENESNKLQQAVPFRMAQDTYNSPWVIDEIVDGHDDDGDDDDDDDGDDGDHDHVHVHGDYEGAVGGDVHLRGSPSPPDLNDEETMESQWTPSNTLNNSSEQNGSPDVDSGVNSATSSESLVQVSRFASFFPSGQSPIVVAPPETAHRRDRSPSNGPSTPAKRQRLSNSSSQEEANNNNSPQIIVINNISVNMQNPP